MRGNLSDWLTRSCNHNTRAIQSGQGSVKGGRTLDLVRFLSYPVPIRSPHHRPGFLRTRGAGFAGGAVIQRGLPYARPQERPRPGLTPKRGAEGATAPETLRQKDCGGKGALESGGPHKQLGRSPKE